MKRYDTHIFICENRRPEDNPKGSCALKNSEEIRKHFKIKLSQITPPLNIRVNSCGCLDACEFGPAMVIYPEGIWYGNFSLNDVDEIIESHILHGKPVERLLIKDKRFHKDAR